jgi:hypothetical protein
VDSGHQKRKDLARSLWYNGGSSRSRCDARDGFTSPESCRFAGERSAPAEYLDENRCRHRRGRRDVPLGYDPASRRFLVLGGRSNWAGQAAPRFRVAKTIYLADADLVLVGSRVKSETGGTGTGWPTIVQRTHGSPWN